MLIAAHKLVKLLQQCPLCAICARIASHMVAAQSVYHLKHSKSCAMRWYSCG